MLTKVLLLSLLISTLFHGSDSNADCDKRGDHSACGIGCTGTPPCKGRRCGNVDNMCYCDCDDDYTCKTTELGYTWNKGIKLANGSYALNGTKGDGNEYACSKKFNTDGIFFIKNVILILHDLTFYMIYLV
jgi:hypothetical protein